MEIKAKIEQVKESLDELAAMLDDIEYEAAELPADEGHPVGYDAEKERISLLVTGKADFYLTNPNQYEKMAPYANEDYPPFNQQTWMMTGLYGRDMRPSYKTIEAMKAGRYSNDPNKPFKG